MRFFDANDPNIRQRLLVENEQAFAFLSKIPIVPGHTIICPKRAVSGSSDLTQNEFQQILLLKESVCAVLKKIVHAEGFNFAWNEGITAGQSVPHFHMHIIPRKTGDAGITQYEPRVFLYRPGSRSESPEEELINFAEEFRIHLESMY